MKRPRTSHGFAVPLQPDTQLGLAMLVAEDEEGHYQPIAVTSTIDEAKELAASDLGSRMRQVERGGDPGLCPYEYKVWAQGIGGDSEAGQGEIVAALALVLQIVTLSQPRVPESHVLVHPAVDAILRDPLAEIDDDLLVVELLFPIPCGLFLRFHVNDPYALQELFEIREVVPMLCRGENGYLFRVGRVLQIPGAGNPEDARQIRQLVIGPTVRRGVARQQPMPTGEQPRGGLALLVVVKDQRLLEQPPGVDAVTG